MKRFLTILLVIAAILALTSCDQKAATAASDANTQSAAPADGGKSDAGAQNGENADPTGGEQSGENIAPVPSTMTQKHIRTTEIENFGYWLDYTPAGQSNQGVPVDLSALQPGDLLFYSNSQKYLGHVALYIGNGQIVHAGTVETGIIVGSAYYRDPLFARRIIP